MLRGLNVNNTRNGILLVFRVDHSCETSDLGLNRIEDEGQNQMTRYSLASLQITL